MGQRCKSRENPAVEPLVRMHQAQSHGGAPSTRITPMAYKTACYTSQHPKPEIEMKLRKHLYVFRRPAARTRVRGKGQSGSMTTVAVPLLKYREMLAQCGSEYLLSSLAREASKGATPERNKSWTDTVLAATERAIAEHNAELQRFAEENNKAWESLS